MLVSLARRCGRMRPIRPRHARKVCTRQLCSSVNDEGAYEEKMQLLQIQEEQFYESEANKRRYFYFVDSKGRLFLEDTVPKNIATSLKSDKFLDFFFRQLRPLSDERSRSLAHPTYAGYYWMSPCGKKEMNYVRAADTPIVFHTFRKSAQGGDATGERASAPSGRELVFGASLVQHFDPTRLRMSREGRLYHELEAGSHRRMGLATNWRDGDRTSTEGGEHDESELLLRTGRAGLGLISSAIAVELSPMVELRSDFEFLQPGPVVRGADEHGSEEVHCDPSGEQVPGYDGASGGKQAEPWPADSSPALPPVAADAFKDGGSCAEFGWPLPPGEPAVVGTFTWEGREHPIYEAPSRPVLLWR